jgi:hypothetical protein
LPDTDRDFLEKLSKETASKINSEALRKVILASIETSRSPIPELPLELAVIELSASAIDNK